VTTITTMASPSTMLGAGQLTDTATVSGGFGEDERIDFRLYGPDDATCSGTPVFQSLDVPYDGGTVTSAPFTPTQTGTYRWRATYRPGSISTSGVFSVTGDCNAANENVLVTAGPPPPPPPPGSVLPTCLGATATIVPAAGQTTIVGTSGRDVIVGADAGETIDGLGGNDVICAGNGDDKVRGGTGRDKILGEVGQDGLFGNSGRDLLLGGAGDDDLRGGSGNDRTGGNGGDDRVSGGTGDDKLDEQRYGGKGEDRLFGGPDDDLVRTAGGTPDNVDCGSGDDSANLDPSDQQVRCEDVS